MRLTGLLCLIFLAWVTQTHSYTRFFSFKAVHSQTKQRIDPDSIRIISEVHDIDTVITSSSILFELPDTGIEENGFAVVHPRITSSERLLKIDYFSDFIVKIFDISGRVIYRGMQAVISLENLSGGLYYLEFESKGLKYGCTITITDDAIFVSKNPESVTIPTLSMKDYPDNEFKFVAYKKWFLADTLFNQDITDYGKMVFEMGLVNDLIILLSHVEYEIGIDSTYWWSSDKTPGGGYEAGFSAYHDQNGKGGLTLESNELGKAMGYCGYNPSWENIFIWASSNIGDGYRNCDYLIIILDKDFSRILEFTRGTDKLNWWGSSTSKSNYNLELENLPITDKGDYFEIKIEGDAFLDSFIDFSSSSSSNNGYYSGGRSFRPENGGSGFFKAKIYKYKFE